MPLNQSNQPRLLLDEQSFEGLLSAAYTIQQHSDRLRQARSSELDSIPTLPKALLSQAIAKPDDAIFCPRCGAAKLSESSPCDACPPSELRPGERLQRNWASMWLMSQEQRLWPERKPEDEIAQGDEAESGGVKMFDPNTPTQNEDLFDNSPKNGSSASGSLPASTARPIAASNYLAKPMLKRTPEEDELVEKSVTMEEVAVQNKPNADLSRSALRITELANLPPSISEKSLTVQLASQTATAFKEKELLDQKVQEVDVPETNLEISELIPAHPDVTEIQSKTTANTSASLLQRLTNLRVTLRFRRADFYLGFAILLAAIALVWPTAVPARHSSLSFWDKTLITLGIAEAPVPAIHFQGDPSIEVWVDPHTALYYCPGEEQYGKTSDGRFSAQRDAQTDRFEPANRAACE